jgi:cytochrome c-type biogenesis protein CcmH/NrfF
VRRPLAALAAAAALLLVPAAALAQDCPRTTLGDIEDEVMCPVCGTPLELATEAPQAQREREYIQRMIDDCRSKDEIKAALVVQFGDAVLALPGDEGDDDVWDALVYVVPGVVIALGAAAIAFAVARWRRRPSGPQPRPAPEGAAAADLDADIERYDL